MRHVVIGIPFIKLRLLPVYSSVCLNAFPRPRPRPRLLPLSAFPPFFTPAPSGASRWEIVGDVIMQSAFHNSNIYTLQRRLISINARKQIN